MNPKQTDRHIIVASEQEVEPHAYVGHLDGYDGNNLRGWAMDDLSPESVFVDIFVNDLYFTSVRADRFRKDLLQAGYLNGCVSFALRLPLQQLFNTLSTDVALSARFPHSGELLMGSPVSVKKPQVKWHIETVNSEKIKGWVYDVNNPHTQLCLQIFVNGECVDDYRAGLECVEQEFLLIENPYHGFEIDLTEYTDGLSVFDVQVSLQYGQLYQLVDSREYLNAVQCVESLTSIERYIRLSENLPEETKKKLSTEWMPALIDALRLDQRSQSLEVSKKTGVTQHSAGVTVVIPVYKNIELTRTSIQSVLASKNEQTFSVVIINDGSPEPGMTALLNSFAADKRCTLINSPQNRGFVKSVNQGMKYAAGDDVILLNSDTQVSDYWIDQLLIDAYQDVRVGTVTPLSNNASIFSFPKVNTNNPLSVEYHFDEVAQACMKSCQKPVKVPTAHGFCMFIKSALIQDVGLFDEETWEKGYGEENDFSLRAEKRGWLNIASNKTFVAHHGSASFGVEASALQKENQAKLDRLYPDYSCNVKMFIENDPLAPLRNELMGNLMKLKCQALTNSGQVSRHMLFVNHNIGGGTQVAADYIEACLRNDGIHVLSLIAEDQSTWRLSSAWLGLSVEFETSDKAIKLVEFLTAVAISHVHYHHVLNFDRTVWLLPDLIGCQYDVSIHDYFYVCPRVHPSKIKGEFCGFPDHNECNRCILENGIFAGAEEKGKKIEIELWRHNSYQRLKKARKVFVPSNDTKKRLCQLLYLENVFVKKHVESRASLKKVTISQTDELHVGILGAISEIKGLNVVKSLAEHIRENQLPIKVTFVGSTADDAFFEPFDFVTVLGRYNNKELSSIIAKSGINVFLIPSSVPETYNFTYSEIHQMGLPVAAFDLGAIAERVKEHQFGELIKLNANDQEIIHVLKRCIKKVKSEPGEVHLEYTSPILRSYYELE